MNSRWKIATRIIGIIVVAAVIVVGVIVYMAASTSLRAENNLHATLFTVSLVDEFVYQNDRWPESWRELEQMQFDGDAYTPRHGELNALRIGGAQSFDWPDVSTKLQKRVQIDFDADLVIIAQQDPMKFNAIFPIGPYFEFRDYGLVQSLQETVRNKLEEKTDSDR